MTGFYFWLAVVMEHPITRRTVQALFWCVVTAMALLGPQFIAACLGLRS